MTTQVVLPKNTPRGKAGGGGGLPDNPPRGGLPSNPPRGGGGLPSNPPRNARKKQSDTLALLKSSTKIHAERLIGGAGDMKESDFPISSIRGSRDKNLLSKLGGGGGGGDESSSSLLNDASGRVHCVCFDMEPNLHYIELRDELTDDDIETIWFTDVEMKSMISSATAVLAGTNKEDVARGLEHYSYEGAQRRRLERSKASEAVLGEQLRQQAAIAFDEAIQNADELIAIEYRKVSKKQQDLAYERAKNDAWAASEDKSFINKSFTAVKGWFSNNNSSSSKSSKSKLVQ